MRQGKKWESKGLGALRKIERGFLPIGREEFSPEGETGKRKRCFLME